MKVEYIDHMGDDATVVNAARVSFGKEIQGELSDKDKKLVSYLAKHKHYSPFEHCSLTVRIKCPLYIRSQIHRHRTFSYNEISRRYTSEEIEFYRPRTFRKQHDSSKQCSDGSANDSAGIAANLSFDQVESLALKRYNDLIGAGVAREQARAILPQSLYTQFYMTGNLRNWAQFLSLRLDSHAQEEAREIAEAIRDIIENNFPICGKALMENLA